MCSCSDDSSNHIFKSRLLSVSLSSLKSYSYPLRNFTSYLKQWSFLISEASISGFLMKMVNEKSTVGSVNLFFNAITFFKSFYELSFEITRQIRDLKKFALMTLEEKRMIRDSFGETEISVLWDRFFNNFHDRSLTEFRTFVMIVILHTTFCRFACLQNVKISNLYYDKDYFKIFVPFSKTDISGKGEYVFVPNRDSSKNPHKLLSLYLHFMNFEKNDFYLFPPLEWKKPEKKWLPSFNRQLSYSAAYGSFKNLLNNMNIEGNFGLHSMRIGAATDAYSNQVSMDVIDRQGRWKCPKSKYRYIKKSDDGIIFELKKTSNYD